MREIDLFWIYRDARSPGLIRLCTSLWSSSGEKCDEKPRLNGTSRFKGPAKCIGQSGIIFLRLTQMSGCINHLLKCYLLTWSHVFGNPVEDARERQSQQLEAWIYLRRNCRLTRGHSSPSLFIRSILTEAPYHCQWYPRGEILNFQFPSKSSLIYGTLRLCHKNLAWLTCHSIHRTKTFECSTSFQDHFWSDQLFFQPKPGK